MASTIVTPYQQYTVNSHYYAVVTASPTLSWSQAKDTAAAMSFNGQQGYLATVTTQGEWDFIRTTVVTGTQDTVWVGGSDAAVEGQWRWVTGPEGQTNNGQGLLFWSGGASGSAQNGLFATWQSSAFQTTGYWATDVTDYLSMYSYFNPAFSSGRGDTAGVSAGGGGSVGFIVEFGGLNSPPSITSSATASTAENISTSTAVYTVTATDPDAGTTLAYSISGGADAAIFNIDAASGAVTFKTSPNFEAPTDSGANNVYDITVRASDGSRYADKALAITVTDLNEGASSATLHGIDYFWKANASGQHALLSGVTDNVTGGTPPPEGSNAPIQFKNITWDATGHAAADVYAHLAAATDALDIFIGVGTGTGASFTSSLTTDFTLMSNQVGNELLIGGMSLTPLAAGDVKVGTIAFETGSAAQMHLSVDKGTTVGSVNATPYGYNVAHATTGADGTYAITSVDAGNYTETASRSTSDIGTAITSADALAALKIAVSINPNAGTGSAQLALSPFQIMAADANQDGKVTSADALAILKMAVHLSTATNPEWMFVEETRDLSGITRTTAAWDHNISANVQGDTALNLAGFIKGDVNGSWAPPTGTQYVETTDPNHFTNLSNFFHIPLSEWGVL